MSKHCHSHDDLWKKIYFRINDTVRKLLVVSYLINWGDEFSVCETNNKPFQVCLPIIPICKASLNTFNKYVKI